MGVDQGEVGVDQVILSVGVHILTNIVGLEGWGGGGSTPNLSIRTLAGSSIM